MSKITELISIAEFEKHCVPGSKLKIPRKYGEPVSAKYKEAKFFINYLKADEIGFNIKFPFARDLFFNNCELKTLKGFPEQSLVKSIMFDSSKIGTFDGTFRNVNFIHFTYCIIEDFEDMPYEQVEEITFYNCNLQNIEGMKNIKETTRITFTTNDWKRVFWGYEKFKEFVDALHEAARIIGGKK